MAITATRILIVEDEQSHANVIKRHLLNHISPVDVVIVDSLRKCAREVAACCPDLLLLDLNLPDGMAIDYLNAEKKQRSYPVLIMTAQGNEASAVAALKAGALDYIVKSPEAFAAIPRTVERSLREWRAQQEHQKALIALQQSEQRFRTLLQDVSSVAVQGYRADGTVHYWNTASERLYGYGADEACGKTLYELIIPPHLKESFEQTIDAMVTSGEPGVAGELALRCKDGSTVLVYSSRALVTKPGETPDIYCIDIDITERKRNEMLLRKLSLAMEQNPASVVITNLDGEIEYVNPKFTEMTGYSFDEVIGQNPRILQAGEKSPEEYRQLWAHLLAGEQWQGEFLNQHKSGRLFWERALISPLRDDQGQITHYVGVKEDITTQKTYEKELEYQATHDALTGLANRVLLMDRLDQAIRYAQRSQRIVAVALLDLDRFKVINDTLGHAAGDTLLCQIADRLKTTVRETDTVARFGGDEFMVLLTEVAAAQDLNLVMEKILQIFTQPFEIEQRQLMLSASIGVSACPLNSPDPETLIRYADIAMYQSKKSGSAFSFYNDEIDSFGLDTLDLEHDLHGALERQEFCLHYQPKVSLRTGTISGCEGLLRWQHPELGMVSPGQFIPLAEETGLIVPIGAWVIAEACRQSLAWQQAGLPSIQIAVNLSARQFRQGDLAATVNALLMESGLDPNLLELELTESMMMDDPQGAEQTLISLKKLGVSLSLDDFGTGYSSLNYLSRFPVDHLKIDQSFIRDIGTSAARTAVVSSIIDIAHNLQLTTIAEGVETTEQLAFLVTNGCDAMQGYLFSKPLPADEFSLLLQQGTSLHDI
ncbi:MAG: EAL domain-containing protein [Pelovirga sp.]